MKLPALFTAFMVCALLLVRYQERWGNRFSVLFLDVGQGDSALLSFPGGTRWLLDSGGGYRNFSFAKTEIIPELSRQGILTLDAAIFSHADADHIFGFKQIFTDMKVQEYWKNAWETQEKALENEIEQIAEKKGIHKVLFTAPQTKHIQGITIQIIPITEGEQSNNQALVLLVQAGKCRLLFTADIEAQAEKKLLTLIKKQSIHVLKIPHHGSKTSSTPAFLQHFTPQYGIISAGKANRYGHPAPSVVERYRKIGTTLLFTPIHGFTRFTLQDNQHLLCEDAFGNCGTIACE